MDTFETVRRQLGSASCSEKYNASQNGNAGALGSSKLQNVKYFVVLPQFAEGMLERVPNADMPQK